MGKHIIFDCDDVLLDWHEGFIDWVGKEKNHFLNPSHPQDSYDMSVWFYDMSKERFIELVEEYNGYSRVLWPMEYSELALNTFDQHGWKIDVLTSFGSCPKMAEVRERYLQMVFGEVFSNIFVLPLGSCKKEYLKDLKPDVFVEDCARHAESSIDLGIKTYLIKTTYNKGVEGAIYVDDLHDVMTGELI